MDSPSFPEQRENENILFWVRKHWVVHAFGFLLLLFFGVVFPAILIWSAELVLSGTRIIGIAYLFTLLVLIYAWLWGYMRFIDNEFDCIILTDQRLIDITQNGLFSMSQAVTTLEKIEDVSGNRPNMLSNVLNYGTLMVQTAGSKIEIMMENVDEPDSAASIIQESRENFLATNNVRRSYEPEVSSDGPMQA